MNINAQRFAENPVGAVNDAFHRMAGGKAQEVTTKLKDAWQAVNELTAGAISISANGRQLEVLVTTMRDLEQVPGEVQIEYREYGEDYPWEASKVFEGVTFCCLLKQEQYEALKAS